MKKYTVITQVSVERIFYFMCSTKERKYKALKGNKITNYPLHSHSRKIATKATN